MLLLCLEQRCGVQAKNCRTVMHPECAGLPGVPDADWFCPKHHAAAKAGKAAKKGPAKAAKVATASGTAKASAPKGKPAKDSGRKEGHSKKKPKREGSSGLAGQSSAEDSAPVPKKQKREGSSAAAKPSSAEDAALPPHVPKKPRNAGSASGVAMQSSGEDATVPTVPKKKRRLVKAGDAQQAQQANGTAEGSARAQEKGSAAPQTVLPKKPEGKAGKPSVGLKVKLKQAKAPE